LSLTRRAGSVSSRSTNCQGITRGGIFSSRARSVKAGDDPLRQPPDGTARPDVHREDVQQEVAVGRRRFELDVVDAHDLASVDVDDLLIEQIALQEQQAVGGGEALPLGHVGAGAHRGAGGRDGAGREHPLTVGGLDDQKRDAGRVVLRRDRDLAHPSTHDAGGVAHGSAEQFRERDDGHGRRSPSSAI